MDPISGIFVLNRDGNPPSFIDYVLNRGGIGGQCDSPVAGELLPKDHVRNVFGGTIVILNILGRKVEKDWVGGLCFIRYIEILTTRLQKH